MTPPTTNSLPWFCIGRKLTAYYMYRCPELMGRVLKSVLTVSLIDLPWKPKPLFLLGLEYVFSQVGELQWFSPRYSLEKSTESWDAPSYGTATQPYEAENLWQTHTCCKSTFLTATSYLFDLNHDYYTSYIHITSSWTYPTSWGAYIDGFSLLEGVLVR